MALHLTEMCVITLRLVREAILHQGAVAGSLVLLGGAVASRLAVDRPVVAAGHEHMCLFGAADRVRGFGDVRKARKLRDVVQQTARLRVGSIAVGVAVFLLDVPPEFPALPLLQDLRLDLWRVQNKSRREKTGQWKKYLSNILCG